MARPSKPQIADPESDEVVRFARRVVRDVKYRQSVMVRAQEGRLHAQMETMLWYYAAQGKPAERVEHRFTDALVDPSTLTGAQLRERMDQLRTLLEQLPEDADPSDNDTVH